MFVQQKATLIEPGVKYFLNEILPLLKYYFNEKISFNYLNDSSYGSVALTSSS